MTRARLELDNYAGTKLYCGNDLEEAFHPRGRRLENISEVVGTVEYMKKDAS